MENDMDERLARLEKETNSIKNLLIKLVQEMNQSDKKLPKDKNDKMQKENNSSLVRSHPMNNEINREKEEIIYFVKGVYGINFFNYKQMVTIEYDFVNTMKDSYIELKKFSAHCNSIFYRYAKSQSYSTYTMALDFVNNAPRIEKSCHYLSQGDVYRIIVSDSGILITVVPEEEILSEKSSLNNTNIFYLVKGSGLRKLNIKDDIQIIQVQSNNDRCSTEQRNFNNYRRGYYRNYNKYRGRGNHTTKNKIESKRKVEVIDKKEMNNTVNISITNNPLINNIFDAPCFFTTGWANPFNN